MTTLFISDLHLDSERPAGVRQFLEFVERDAMQAEALYILGDLFEVWIGDDDTHPGHSPIIEALATLKRRGVACFFMQGNRDFLVGKRFAAATGCRLLDEHEVVELEGTRVLLTHGDLLCTDDTPYLALRATVRDPQWQRSFLAKPLTQRRTIANELRDRSQQAIAGKPPEIMDVNQRTVEATMREHNVRVLLHGHTHRPGIHHFDLDGVQATRIVLGAWYEEGSVLRWGTDGYRLETLRR